MRGMVVLLAIVAVASCAFAVAAVMRIGAWLSAHGVKVGWLWYRATFPWYVERYKTMTTELDGKPGPLFRQLLVTAGVALLFGAAALLAVIAGGR